MPVIRAGLQAIPAWCDLTAFAIMRLPVGASQHFPRCGNRERLIIAAGVCCLTWGANTLAAGEGAKVELDTDETFAVSDVREPVTLVRLCGRWGDETGGWGLFAVRDVPDPIERGDPTDYPKRTGIDNHYHDCDEYWIILEGSGVAVSEGTRYAVTAGDCIATGMGHHHDFPIVHEPVKAVYFETTLQGARRRGHLWEHTHGPATPQPDRI